MQINLLINVLKNGYQYSHTKEDGTAENVLVPPNKYMIAGAMAIEALHTSLQQSIKLNTDLTNQLEASYKELQNAEAPIQNPSTISADGDASSDFQRSTDKG